MHIQTVNCIRHDNNNKVCAVMLSSLNIAQENCYRELISAWRS